MPAAAFAVSGRARAMSSRLNLVERLAVEADDQMATAWHPSQPPRTGGSIRERGRGYRGPSWAAPTATRRDAGGLLRGSRQKTSGNARLRLKSQSPRAGVPLAPST